MRIGNHNHIFEVHYFTIDGVAPGRDSFEFLGRMKSIREDARGPKEMWVFNGSSSVGLRYADYSRSTTAESGWQRTHLMDDLPRSRCCSVTRNQKTKYKKTKYKQGKDQRRSQTINHGENTSQRSDVATLFRYATQPTVITCFRAIIAFYKVS